MKKKWHLVLLAALITHPALASDAQPSEASVRELMRWEVLEPILIDIYRQSFTQSEIDGMLAFYRSEVGQAVIAKMPVVMQNSIQAMQARVAALMPKLQQLQRETVAQLIATEQ